MTVHQNTVRRVLADGTEKTYVYSREYVPKPAVECKPKGPPRVPGCKNDIIRRIRSLDPNDKDTLAAICANLEILGV